MTAQLASHLTQVDRAAVSGSAAELGQPTRAARADAADRDGAGFLGKTVTWDELQRRVVALAGCAEPPGVGFGDRVMILMLNRTEFVESVLAVNSLGAIAVPLNFRLTPPEIAFLVEDCEARVMITESVLAPVATGVREHPAVARHDRRGGWLNRRRPCSATKTSSTSTGDPHGPADVPTTRRR